MEQETLAGHIEICRKSLVETAAKIVGDDLAEDVVQCASMTALEKADTIKGHLPSTIAVWLRNVTRHIAIDVLRKKREANVSLDEVHPNAVSTSDAMHSAGFEIGVDVQAALATLSDEEQDIAVECLINGRSQEEVGQELGLHRESVKRRVAAVKAKLQVALAAYNPEKVRS